MRGVTLTELALNNGLPEAACRIALRKHHGPAEKVIAQFLGVAPLRLWPERYRKTRRCRRA